MFFRADSPNACPGVTATWASEIRYSASCQESHFRCKGLSFWVSFHCYGFIQQNLNT